MIRLCVLYIFLHLYLLIITIQALTGKLPQTFPVIICNVADRAAADATKVFSKWMTDDLKRQGRP